MTTLTADKLEQLRKHFNKAPYPNIPLDAIPEDRGHLYLHSLATAFYRRDQIVVDPSQMVILDAGCGTGYKSFELAIANPGAKIVGIDISEDSVEMAKQRMAYHKVENCEFYAIPLERLSELNMQFDYINCDDVLYLVPDPVLALQAMKSVLKPKGIIRVNYHSTHGRGPYIIAQDFFRTLGCMQGPPDDAEISLVRQTMKAMKPYTTLRGTWSDRCEVHDESVLANHLLQNDKTWTVHQFFNAMRSADIEFFSMVDWWTWNLTDLFDVDNLPLEVVMQLSDLSIEAQLAVHESVHVVHRLLDIWCGHAQEVVERSAIEDWTEAMWFKSRVHFHPLLLSDEFKANLCDCAGTSQMLNITKYLKTTTIEPQNIFIDSLMAGCLLLLLEGGKQFSELLHRWMHLRPINPVSMDPIKPEDVFEPLSQILGQLESIGYILIEGGKA
jgi:ubiquinone/menaquinone biosynthesis C-methylase UbiE